MTETLSVPSGTRSTDLRDGQLSVVLAHAGTRATWDAFVSSHPNGSFYHLYDWRTINEQELGHDCEYLAVERAGTSIEGVLPLVFVQSRLFGRILCSMPFMNFGGPIATSEAATSLLMEHARRRANELKADYLELRSAISIDTNTPVSLRKISMTVPLDPDPEVLFNSFSQKHRKNIRRAQKNELDVRVGGLNLLDEFYRVIERSWHSLGTPLYSRSYFQRILATFPENTCVYICHHKGTPVAAAVTGHFNGIVEGMWAGVDPALRHLQANYVLYWEMLRDACTKGYTKFHLGRSTADSGAEQFKSKWNAELHQLYWYFHRPDGGAMPELNVDNPKFKLAIAAWRRMPLWATRLVGPPLARLIP